MNASKKAWLMGVEGYKSGTPYSENPYNKIDDDLAADWLEGWQMASYQERQNSVTKSIN